MGFLHNITAVCVVCSWVWVTAIWCYYFHTLHTHLSGLDNNIFPLFFYHPCRISYQTHPLGNYSNGWSGPRFFSRGFVFCAVLFIYVLNHGFMHKNDKSIIAVFQNDDLTVLGIPQKFIDWTNESIGSLLWQVKLTRVSSLSASPATVGSNLRLIGSIY